MARIQQSCDFCKEAAKYDAKMTQGPWAFMCQHHFDTYASKVQGTFSVLETVTLTKTCIRCGKTKPVVDFYKYNDTKGVARLRNECKECNLAERKVRSFK